MYSALHISHQLRELLDYISQHTSQSYVVGGAIRDVLLGKGSIKDIDVVIQDDPVRVCQGLSEIKDLVPAIIVELDRRRSIFRLIIRDSGDVFVDISPIRGDALVDDLRARDFTINAIAIPTEHFLANEWQYIIDPLNGSDDLKNGILRMCSRASFSEDPLRILRAFRFRAQLHMRIEKATWISAVNEIQKLSGVSGERIRDELVMALVAANAAHMVDEMESLGVLRRIFPYLSHMKGCVQNEHHHLDVWDHTLECIRMFEVITQDISLWLGPHSSRATDYLRSEPTAGRSKAFLIKLSLLFHDSGKPERAFVDTNGRKRFSGHEKLSAEIFEHASERLRLSNSEKAVCVSLIRSHMRASILIDPNCSKRAMYRLSEYIGEELIGLCLLFLSDVEATRGSLSSEESRRRAREGVLRILDYADSLRKASPKRMISGNDVINILGLKEGPIIGHILKRVDEAIAIGKAQTRSEAIEEARLALKSMNPPD